MIGCYVNGPGEAREVEIGVTGAAPQNLIFIDGKPSHKVAAEALTDELERLIRERAAQKSRQAASTIARG